MRTVVFEVSATIGWCDVKIEDDNLSDEEAKTMAMEKIADSGVDEPSEGIRFYENDSADENDLLFKEIK